MDFGSLFDGDKTMNTLPFDVKPLSSGAKETMRCLFFHGPTWDGNIPDKSGRKELIELGYASHEFAHAFLTRDGVQVAVQIFGMDKDKEIWQRDRTKFRRPDADGIHVLLVEFFSEIVDGGDSLGYLAVKIANAVETGVYK